MNKKKKVLFIGPVYYEYQDSIKKGIEETLPAKVTFLPDINFGRLKVHFLKNLKRFDSYVVKNVRHRIEEQICTNKDYDYVFVLKGEFLQKDTVKYMRQHLSNACFIYYNWDSFKRNPSGYDIYKLFDRKFSFDRVDCERNNDITYLPLFIVLEILLQRYSNQNLICFLLVIAILTVLSLLKASQVSVKH